MIIYDQNLKEGLVEFGIEIPVHHSRAANTYKKLQAHKILSTKINYWHIKEVKEYITQDDLLRVHSKEYVASFNPAF
jgi:hypothetical protein